MSVNFYITHSILSACHTMGEFSQMGNLRNEDMLMHDIYDKIFKKILTLSTTAVSNLINGLFDTNYPPNSTITYNWTEFESDTLDRKLADTILTINGHAYHIEAQMTKDDSIVFRVFDYGYRFAERTSIDGILSFPEPRIIYLYTAGPAPDEYTLKLDFGSQGSFDYKVKTFKYLEISTEEINRRKMVILIPFSLLKLRDKLIKHHHGSFSEDELASLKSLIDNDIIGSIKMNYQLGNISDRDFRKLNKLTSQLFKHMYVPVGIEEEDVGMDMSIILPEDIVEYKLAKAEEELVAMAAENESVKAENESVKAENESLRSEIERLKSQLSKM